MPLTNGRYTSPTWVNGQAPAIDAAELQAMTDTIAGNQQRIAAITLTAGLWSGTGPYTQAVTISGQTITGNTKVDLIPNPTIVSQMVESKTTSLFIVNNNGELTAYAIGAALNATVSVQAVLTEVSQ